ncbi:MAG TPA: hypothetical protein VF710_00500 [Longimicrobium sp.]|jgi:hypothetical protein
MAAEDDGGYVYGQTMLHGSMDMSWVWAWTEGKGADLVRIEGYIDVGLMSTVGGHWKSEREYYAEMAYGDEVGTSAEIRWDYNWQMQYTDAVSEHDAQYGSFISWTVSQASR